MQIRPPAVAGQFYPGRKEKLAALLKQLLGPARDKKKVLGVMSPHAGYVYSGGCAGRLFAAIQIPSTAVILGVNHHGIGAPYAIDDREGWETPLGIARLELELCKKIQACCPELEVCRESFDAEHSLEVQVPFLQYVAPATSIVPIAIGGYQPDVFRSLGLGIAKALREWGKETLIVASSDMTHYEEAATAKKKDEKALEAILKLDQALLLKRLSEYSISMCGFAPVAIMLEAAKTLGATQAKLVHYCNSGDVSGDYDSVVAYAAVAVIR